MSAWEIVGLVYALIVGGILLWFHSRLDDVYWYRKELWRNEDRYNDLLHRVDALEVGIPCEGRIFLLEGGTSLEHVSCVVGSIDFAKRAYMYNKPPRQDGYIGAVVDGELKILLTYQPMGDGTGEWVKA